MPFLDDFANAVSGYPTASVQLSIVDRVAVAPATGPAVNVNEVWQFQVRVANNGHLNMSGVSLHVLGLNGALVSLSATAPQPWPTSVTIGNLTVNSHGGQQDTANLFFKAPTTPKPAGTELVSAHINTFDVNLTDILINHSAHSATPTGPYADQVFPS